MTTRPSFFTPAFREGASEAFGAPVIAMAATFIAFGAAVAEAGLPLLWALLCSAVIYGMAGQIVLLGLVAAPGAAVVPAVVAATAANARFLPMAVSLSPLLGPRQPAWRRMLALPFIAITPWALSMRRLPGLPESERLNWFLGFALTTWTAGLLITSAGHLVAPAALVFTNPFYFALLLAGDLGRPGVRWAVIGGAAAAPAALWLGVAWGLLAAGLIGGTAAFLWERRRSGAPEARR